MTTVVHGLPLVGASPAMLQVNLAGEPSSTLADSGNVANSILVPPSAGTKQDDSKVSHHARYIVHVQVH